MEYGSGAGPDAWGKAFGSWQLKATLKARRSVRAPFSQWNFLRSDNEESALIYGCRWFIVNSFIMLCMISIFFC